MAVSKSLAFLVACVVAAIAVPAIAQAQARDDPSLSIELVDPKVFRVCADPHNLPFSNEAGEGFENKIAQLIAGKLDRSVSYAWFPQAVGFLRNTLNAHRCDVVMGFPQGGELAQSTNPYYRTAYALVSRPGNGPDGVDHLTDERLKGKHLGIVAGTPPATHLAVNGLMANAKPYPLVIDTRVDSSAESMMKDLAAGTIDAAILWGPRPAITPSSSATASPSRRSPRKPAGRAWLIAFPWACVPADQNWKRQLDRVVRENQGEINAILTGYGVPLLDDNDRPLK